MSRNDRRFARFYYDDFIREFPEVYRDDAALAAWTRLLVVAEKAWPLDPELPRSVRVSALRTLTGHGLIAVGPDQTFAVRGYRAERLRRQAAGRAGADAKWGANADANADAGVLLVRERERERDIPPTPAKRGLRAEGKSPRQLAAKEREAERERAHKARLEATQRRIRETRGDAA